MTLKLNYENLKVGEEYSYSKLCECLGIKKKSGTMKNMVYVEVARRFVVYGNRGLFIKSKRESVLPYNHKDLVEYLPEYRTVVRDMHDVFLGIIKSDKNILKPYELDKLSKISEKKYWFKCYDCKKEYYTSPYLIQNNPYYNNDTSVHKHCCSMSNASSDVLKFLNNEGFKYDIEYKFNDLVGINGGYLRFDFAIFDNNDELVALIEYDGQYHFKDATPDDNAYEYIKAHDEIKNNYCKENNIPLLRIPYHEQRSHLELIFEFLSENCNLNELRNGEIPRIEQHYKDIIEELSNIKNFKVEDYEVVNKIYSAIRLRKSFWED